ncbi:defensin [Dermacentor andersoni]|uniref:Defensin n=2 Tax=Dermacentor TaxID=34619 RepID=DEF1_DERVA|nr:defensin [Dermacentor andersoni]Q86QI5.1 RecName: Full=Defensin; AltName: Full=Varisin A1; Flags: Precursor [Dermacentor variabilis]AAO24323.1 varisin A1 [Dermacentor variabilis]ABK62866.1 defensin [Dermacentor andersoni]
MRGLCICLVFLLVCGLVSATAAAPAESEVAHLRVRRGFGCPLNQGACHNHCRSIRRRGGYCSGIIKQTCTCYRN